MMAFGAMTFVTLVFLTLPPIKAAPAENPELGEIWDILEDVTDLNGEYLSKFSDQPGLETTQFKADENERKYENKNKIEPNIILIRNRRDYGCISQSPEEQKKRRDLEDERRRNEDALRAKENVERQANIDGYIKQKQLECMRRREERKRKREECLRRKQERERENNDKQDGDKKRTDDEERRRRQEELDREREEEDKELNIIVRYKRRIDRLKEAITKIRAWEAYNDSDKMWLQGRIDEVMKELAYVNSLMRNLF